MKKFRHIGIFMFGCCLVFAPNSGWGQTLSAATQVIAASQRVAAPNFTVTDVQGKPFTLNALKGRVVLLDFWAIACGGCKLELPWYVGFDQQYRNKGLSLIGLDMYGEKAEAVKSFASAHQMHYPVAIGTDEIGSLYKLGEMPLTVLIDRKGRVAVSHTGVIDPKVFESDIKLLLSE